MSSHTPEPWDNFGPIIHRNGQHIAHVCADPIPGSSEVGTPEQRANTALMTAAPRLLKALQKIVRINGSSGGAESLVREFKFIAESAIGELS